MNDVKMADHWIGITWWVLWMNDINPVEGQLPFIVYKYYGFDTKKKKHYFEDRDKTHMLVMNQKEILSTLKPFVIDHHAIMDYLDSVKKETKKNADDRSKV